MFEEASGLPNAAYWSEDWFEMEQEFIFRRSWVFAGARAEIAEGTSNNLKAAVAAGLGDGNVPEIFDYFIKLQN